MRIVQSVKHTKKREGQWLKEGWLVHFTNKDKTVGTHFTLCTGKSPPLQKRNRNRGNVSVLSLLAFHYLASISLAGFGFRIFGAVTEWSGTLRFFFTALLPTQQS